MSIKHAVLSTKLFSFNTVPAFQGNTAVDSSDHFATSNVDTEVSIKTVLFILRRDQSYRYINIHITYMPKVLSINIYFSINKKMHMAI
jgi:hypothetical protein